MDGPGTLHYCRALGSFADLGPTTSSNLGAPRFRPNAAVQSGIGRTRHCGTTKTSGGASLRIVAHDEDSMTNLFFCEVHRHDKLNDFLSLIEWRNGATAAFGVASAELHQQVNFSEFGRPDAIILVTDSKGQKHVVIVEVKLGAYLDSCVSISTGKFGGSNSALNNQLALKYRAMISLPSIAESGFITEAPHSPESPYSEDKVRRCKKPSTIRFFSDLVGAPFYLVTLTSDSASPTRNEMLAASDPCFPWFFDQHRDHQEEFANLGSVSWDRAAKLFDGVDSHVAESFALHFGDGRKAEEPKDALDRSELFVSGVQIIEFDGKICHLSCRNYSFAIRHFRDGHFVVIYR